MPVVMGVCGPPPCWTYFLLGNFMKLNKSVGKICAFATGLPSVSFSDYEKRDINKENHKSTELNLFPLVDYRSDCYILFLILFYLILLTAVSFLKINQKDF